MKIYKHWKFIFKLRSYISSKTPLNRRIPNNNQPREIQEAQLKTGTVVEEIFSFQWNSSKYAWKLRKHKVLQFGNVPHVCRGVVPVGTMDSVPKRTTIYILIWSVDRSQPRINRSHQSWSRLFQHSTINETNPITF
jgi:hypothetical protein